VNISSSFATSLALFAPVVIAPLDFALPPLRGLRFGPWRVSIPLAEVPGTNLDAALSYARRGWRIFPLEPGTKVPHGAVTNRPGPRLAPTGFKVATCDEATVRSWWSKAPTAGIGWVPGPDHLVIDVDVKNGKDGVSSLAQIAQGRELETLCSLTPSGGFHLILACRETGLREGTDVLGPGLDVRMSNGYVVLPPTVIAQKRYRWRNWWSLATDADIKPAPAWLVDMLKSARTPSPVTASGAEDLAEFERQAVAERATEETVVHLKAALGVIPADDYRTWIAMGEALASLRETEHGLAAEELWIDWSSTSEKFDESVAHRAWQSFRPTRTTYAAVFAEAQRLGWVNPAAHARALTASDVIARLRALSLDQVGRDWIDMSKPLSSQEEADVVREVAHLTKREVRELKHELKSARQAERTAAHAASIEERANGRTLIRYRPEDKLAMSNQLESEILKRAGEGEYITFAGQLCEVATRLLPGMHLIDHGDLEPPPVPVIAPLDAVALLERGERVATFYTVGKQGEQLIGVPKAVIDILLGQRRHGAPEVSGLVTHPIVLPSGEILATDGRHHGSKLYLHGATGGGARSYAHGEAIAAVTRLRTTFLEGFEFADEWDADVALAGLFTAVQRRVLDTSPGLLVKAHMQSSGKTTLVRRMHVVLTGQDLAVSTFPRGDETEVQKRLLSALMRSPAIVCFDNFPDGERFESPSISGAMTLPTFTQRMLGASRDVEVPTHSLFVVTGNNLTLGADEDSRWLVCCLAPKNSRPSERTFRHPDVVGHALKIRHQVLQDVVGIIAGYLASGQEMQTATRFARWDRMVRQPLLWSGCSDMSRNFSSNADQSDASLALAHLLSSLFALFDEKEFSAKQLTTPTVEDEFEPGPRSDLDEALAALGSKSRDDPGSIGKVLKKVVGKVARVSGPRASQDMKLLTRLLNGNQRYQVEIVK
jgi:Bifunctional DNA primase/polymerase, N-terminal/Primase C terminal 2 (PriCT-2)